MWGGLGFWSHATAPVVASGNTHAYRYYRLLATAAGNGGAGIGLAEFEIATTAAGADTTAGMTATASSSFGTETPDKAIDDNFATSADWASDFSGTWPQWLMIDYGATSGNWVAANEFRISARGVLGGAPGTGDNDQAPKDFKLQGSDNASAWTDLITKTGELFTGLQTKAYVVP